MQQEEEEEGIRGQHDEHREVLYTGKIHVYFSVSETEYKCHQYY